MNKTILSYKNYLGSVEISIEDDCLHGQIMFINDLVTYEAASPAEIEKEFKLAVDDYIETCEELGKEPQKSYKGSLNVRLGSELHRSAAIQAQLRSETLNEFIKKATMEKIKGQEVKRHVHEHSIRPESETIIATQEAPFMFGQPTSQFTQDSNEDTTQTKH